MYVCYINPSLPPSQASSSATDTEVESSEAAPGVTATVRSVDDSAHHHPPGGSESEGDGGGSDREKRKVTTSRRKSRPPKIATTVKKAVAATEKQPREGEVAEKGEEAKGVSGNVATAALTSGEGGSSEEGDVGEGEEEGRSSGDLYSPVVQPATPPLRDTIKLGPLR